MRDVVDAMLTGALLLSALMIGVWLLRLKSQGARAYVMAAAFACLGGCILSLKQAWPTFFSWTCGVILVILLVADLGIKMARQAKEKP